LKAALIDATGKLRMAEVPKPEPAEGEVLVKLRCCGVCGTDLEKVNGHGITSSVVGHEEVGEVAAVGHGVKGLAIGDRVFAHHHVPCGSCELCRRGEGTLCPEYSKHNLAPCGLAEYFIVPKYNVERGAVLKLPDSLSFEQASFIEPLACCIRGLEMANARAVSSVLIYGAGPIGLMQLKLLKSYGRKTVIVADVSEYRLGLAADMGAEGTFNVSNASERNDVLAFLKGGPELVVLATGSSAALEDALSVVGKGGTVLLFGAPKKNSRASIDTARFFLNGTKLVTSYAATETETAEAMKLLSDGTVEVMDLITHRFPLEQTEEAFAVAGEQKCMKALITD
jgi:L-iditol 2-dehydrogenase